jgi:hypothetical protein
LTIVKLDAEDLRRQYAEYPDEFLLELNREDLTDVARACYDAELSRRGLAPLEAEEELPVEEEAQAEPDEERPEDLVVVDRFQNPDELAEARDALENAKIPCFLDSADPERSRQHPFILKVPRSFHGQAVAILHPEIAEPGNNLQPVASFPTTEEAETLRALLEAADIPCQVALMVPAAYYDRACEILEKQITREG